MNGIENQIASLLLDGYDIKDVADIFNVSKRYVRDIDDRLVYNMSCKDHWGESLSDLI